MVGVGRRDRRRATTGRCSAFWPARSTAWSPTPIADIDFVNALLAAPMRWCGRAGRPSPNIAVLTPAEIRRAHPHLTVTSITPFGLDGPWCDRPATEFTLQAWSGGIVGLGRGSADRAPVYVGGQVGEYLAGAYASAATLASADARWRGTDRPVDAGDPDPRPHLLSGDLLRDARQAVARRPAADGARHRARQGRPGRHRLRHRAAVVRPVRDDRTQDWIDEESPLSITEQANENADELYAWVESQTVDEIRDLATAFRIPNAPVANGANIDSASTTSSGARVVRHQPPRRFRPARPSLPHDARACFARPSRRRASANTPSTTAETDIRVAKRRDFDSRNVRFGGTAVRGSARARHDDVLGGAVVHAHARACSAPRSSMWSRRGGPTAPG